jgi:uncharacterized MAPEG superfamily protein
MSSIAVAWLLIYAPRILVIIASRQQFGRLENNHPRDQQAKLSGWGRRALAAHENAFESFAPFAAAVLVAHIGGGDPRWIEIGAATYLISRVVYIALYVANLGLPRTAVWAVGLLSTGALFALPLGA